VRKQVNTTVAQLFAWSIQISMDGKAPSVGFFEEELTGYRAEIAGQQLAKGLSLPAKPPLNDASLGGTDYAELSSKYKAIHVK
ncbi:unnamed protein product, partial [Durusdinium trenchii]